MAVISLHINYGTTNSSLQGRRPFRRREPKTKQLQALKLIVLQADDGVEVDCDGACPASAEGVMISGDGAGAGIGGIIGKKHLIRIISKVQSVCTTS